MFVIPLKINNAVASPKKGLEFVGSIPHSPRSTENPTLQLQMLLIHSLFSSLQNSPTEHGLPKLILGAVLECEEKGKSCIDSNEPFKFNSVFVDNGELTAH